MTSRNSSSRGSWRRVRVVAALLVAGCVVSVGLAWILAAAYDNRWQVRRERRPRSTAYLIADRQDAPLAIQRAEWLGWTSWTLERLTLVREPRWPFQHIQSIPVSQGLSDPEDNYVIVKAFGVPFRSLARQMSVERTNGLFDISSRRWYSSQFAVSWSNTHIALPLRVLWPGMMGNAVLYGAVLGAPLGLFVVRRRLRRRCGHCSFCGYDLRGDFSRVCSECGRGGAGVGVDAVTEVVSDSR